MILALAFLGLAIGTNAQECQLSVDGQSYVFDFCPNAPDANMKLYYTLEPSGTSKTLFRGGLKAISTGWAGFGFSETGKEQHSFLL